MGLAVTIGLAVLGAAIGLACGWMGARPVKLMSAPRLVPWRILMMFAFAFVVACLVHLVGFFHHP
jgi:hypothetical protein